MDSPQPPRPATNFVPPASLAGVIMGALAGLPSPYNHWVSVGGTVLWITALFATQVPAPMPNSWLVWPYKFLMLLSANFGQSRNADDTPGHAVIQKEKPVIDSVLPPEAIKDRIMDTNDTKTSTTATESTATTAATPVASAPATTQSSTDNSPNVTIKRESITDMISAGEDVYTAITGKKTPDTVKVVSGFSAIAEVMLPSIDARVGVDLEDVVGGTTEVLTGVSTIVTAFKKKQA